MTDNLSFFIELIYAVVLNGTPNISIVATCNGCDSSSYAVALTCKTLAVELHSLIVDEVESLHVASNPNIIVFVGENGINP